MKRGSWQLLFYAPLLFFLMAWAGGALINKFSTPTQEEITIIGKDNTSGKYGSHYWIEATREDGKVITYNTDVETFLKLKSYTRYTVLVQGRLHCWRIIYPIIVGANEKAQGSG